MGRLMKFYERWAMVVKLSDRTRIPYPV